MEHKVFTTVRKYHNYILLCSCFIILIYFIMRYFVIMNYINIQIFFQI